MTSLALASLGKSLRDGVINAYTAENDSLTYSQTPEQSHTMPLGLHWLVGPATVRGFVTEFLVVRVILVNRKLCLAKVRVRKSGLIESSDLNEDQVIASREKVYICGLRYYMRYMEQKANGEGDEDTEMEDENG